MARFVADFWNITDRRQIIFSRTHFDYCVSRLIRRLIRRSITLTLGYTFS